MVSSYDVMKGLGSALDPLSNPNAAKNKQAIAEAEARKACLANGGKWKNGECVMSSLPKKEELKPPEPVKLTPTQQAKGGFITDKLGNQKIQTKEDLQNAKWMAATQGNSANELIKQQQAAQQQQLAGQQLAGQVGQFNQLGVEERPLGGVNVGDSFTSGLIQNVPKAASYAAGVAFVTGAGTNPISWGAAGATFVGTLASGLISDMKDQRRDITNSQKRVLDEGKQMMKDWSTMAKVDPTNRAYYLAQYNQVSAQIDQAYRQMKLDTSKDIAKFEKSIPDLAEFEAFYATGGENENLDIEMQTALQLPGSTEYDMIELANRRYTNA